MRRMGQGETITAFACAVASSWLGQRGQLVSHLALAYVDLAGRTLADPGEGPGGPCPPVFLDQSKARRVEKIIWRPQGLYDRPTPPPPPPSISQGLDPALENDPIPRNNFSPCIWGLNEVPVLLKDRIQEFIVTQSEVQPFNVP